LNNLLSDDVLYEELRLNCLQARNVLNWENEKQYLLDFYRHYKVEKHLHIISFNVPYPADYGGAVDVFYKLKALHAAGDTDPSSLFYYGRSEQPELNKYCASVNYYERHIGHKGISNTLPYIVSSRKNEQLLQDLLKDDHPILMEGVHCTCLLFDKRFSNRKCFVRLHNAEFQYYSDLCKASSSLIKKMYYWIESRLLKSYEKKIASKAMFFGITEKDTAVYRDELNCKNIHELHCSFLNGGTMPRRNGRLLFISRRSQC
jgi:hypothetical protein